MRTLRLHRISPLTRRNRRPKASTGGLASTTVPSAHVVASGHRESPEFVKMSETAKILDRARQRLGLTSDNQLAQALGFSQSAVSSWRRGRSTFGVEYLCQFSERTGIPLVEVISAAAADTHARRANRQTVGRKAA
ncbi:helix-turn-helix domain-containing protein [Sinimarinibacterium flocculans]|uniref:helix-turn-helix domain-containing protein n=1 Tax=Sinimarinibacterium flocculans TaxID=985250 RepID=UPI00344EBE13